MLDTLIRNALIVDGAGNPGYYGDLAVEKGRIAAIGHLPSAQAATVIDAAGKVLCPGFIDVHLHSEVDLLAGVHVEGVQMGVTTELICPDGMSYAPMPPAMLQEFGRYVFGIYASIPAVSNPLDFAGYLDLFKGRMHNNIVAQAPHGVIRLAVKGWATGPAMPDEVTAMQKLVRECMEAGAVGFNTGLGYAPAAHAALPEIVALCKVVAEYGGVYSAHMRNYGDERDASIAETVGISEQTGIPVHINHFSGTPAVYASAEAARARGIDITWDAYPYTAGCTLLSYGLPVSMFSQPIDTLVAGLRQPAVRRRLQPHLDAFFPPDSPAFFAFTKLPANKWMEGKPVRQAWQASGKAFVDFYCDLLIEEDLAPLLIYPWTDSPEMIEARLRHTLTHPLHMVSTDGIYVGSHTHPAATAPTRASWAATCASRAGCAWKTPSAA